MFNLTNTAKNRCPGTGAAGDSGQFLQPRFGDARQDTAGV